MNIELFCEGEGERETYLRPHRNKLIPNRRQRDRVLDILVQNFKHAALGHIILNRASPIKQFLLRDIARSQRVQTLIPIQRNRVRGCKAVRMSTNRRINAHIKQMLMIRRHDTIRHTGTPGHFGVLANRLRGKDTRCASLEGDFAGLVKVPHKDILVVRDGDDSLQDELALADDSGLARAVVGVFPLDAVVDFVGADGVRSGRRRAIRAHDAAVEVLDHAETVTAELEVVGCDACTDVAEIEGALAVDGVAGVAVGHEHLGEREAVEGAAAVEGEIVQGEALAPVEADAESPFLPFDEVAGDGEGGAFGLDDLVGL